MGNKRYGKGYLAALAVAAAAAIWAAGAGRQDARTAQTPGQPTPSAAGSPAPRETPPARQTALPEDLSGPMESWVDENGGFVYEPGYGREEALRACGLQGSEPAFTYLDEEGRPQLELYLDEAAGAGCGFRYDRDESGQVWIYGFALARAPEAGRQEVWGQPAILEYEGLGGWGGLEAGPWSTLSVWGTDGSEEAAGYQETLTRTADGKPLHFHSSALAPEGEGVQGPLDMLDIEFFYREDGTLRCKQYFHNERMFGTTFFNSQLYYDEAERLAFVHGYITHGALEYYYIYRGEETVPAWCLCMDKDMGVYQPALVRL